MSVPWFDILPCDFQPRISGQFLIAQRLLMGLRSSSRLFKPLLKQLHCNRTQRAPFKGTAGFDAAVKFIRNVDRGFYVLQVAVNGPDAKVGGLS